MEEHFTFKGTFSYHCLEMFKDKASNFQGVGKATRFLNSHPRYYFMPGSTFHLTSPITGKWHTLTGTSPPPKINSLTRNLPQQATSRLSFSKQKRYKKEGFFFSYFFVQFFLNYTSKEEKMKVSEEEPEENLTANGECRHSWLDARTWENKYKSCKKIVKFVVGETGRGQKVWI